MSVILLVLGILVTTAGVVLIGFGIPINDLSLLNTFVLAGTFALVGGLLLVGLSAVATELRRVADALRLRQPARQARPVEASAPSAEAVARDYQPAEEARPTAAPAAVDVSASAIERLRTAIPRSDKGAEAEEVPLSPNGQQAHNGQSAPHVAPSMEPATRAPAAGAGVETVREPRLDFLFRQRQARPASPAEFDSVWPKRGRRETPADPRVEVARAPAPSATVDAPPVPPEETYVRPHPSAGPEPQPEPPVEEVRTVAILKSGVVDGMAYTLYADGSIEAQLPQGTVRFGSIAELRAHIENNSHASH